MCALSHFNEYINTYNRFGIPWFHHCLTIHYIWCQI